MPKHNPKHHRKHLQRKIKSKYNKKIKKTNEKNDLRIPRKQPDLNEMNLFIISEFKQFNFEELFLWISVTSIHPNNAKYQVRFEYLMVILLSLEESEFEHQSLTRLDFIAIMDNFIRKFSLIFMSNEDFEPFDLLKVIPLFFGKEKYYFFQGAEERTYEMWKSLENCYVSNNSLNRDIGYENFYLFSLRVQSKIIEKLLELKESEKNSTSIYIPSDRFFTLLKPLFEIQGEETFTSEELYEIGECKEDINKTNFKRNIFNGLFYKKLGISISRGRTQKFVLLPQSHVEILLNDFYNRTVNSKLKKDHLIIFQNHIEMLIQQYSVAYFGFGNSIKNFILDEIPSKIRNEGDSIFIYDNYIFIFPCLSLLPTSSLQKSLKNGYKRISTLISSIKNAKKVELTFKNGGSLQINPENIKYRTFFIFEFLDLSNSSITGEFPASVEFQLLLLKDLVAYFEFLPTPIEFVKFINDKYHFAKTSLTFDEINHLAVYILNNHAFPHQGLDFNIYSLDPHYWCSFFNDKMHKKYTDPIYSRLNGRKLHFFNMIKQWEENPQFYKVMNTDTMTGADISLLQNRILYVYYPVFQKIRSKNDIKNGMRVFAPMFTDYISRMENAFENVLVDNSYDGDLILQLCPIHKDFNPYIEDHPESSIHISEERPLYIEPYQKAGDLIFLIFYDIDKWINKFTNYSENDPQKYAMIFLLRSMMKFFKPQLSSEEIDILAQEITTKSFPIGPNDYFLTAIPTFNKNIEQYPPPILIPNAYYENVIEKAEKFIKRENQIGNLTPEESKAVFNKLFEMFYKSLLKEINICEESLLLFAYQQYELLLGQHKKLSYDLASKSLFIKEKDKIQKLNEEFQETTNSISVVRYLIEIILKRGLNGTKIINQDDWCKLIAKTFYMLQISQRSDWIHSELIPFTIEISDLYKYKEIQQSGKFDYDQFNEDELNNKISNLSKIFLKDPVDQSETQNSKEFNIYVTFWEQLNQAFKEEFLFSLINGFRFLFLCARLDSSQSKYFPVGHFSNEELIELLQNQFNIDYHPDESVNFNAELVTMIEFFSLNFNSYDEIQDMLLLSNILRLKARLSICPLIKTIDLKYIISSESSLFALSIWKKNVLTGRFPYVLEEDHPINTILEQIRDHFASELEIESGIIAETILGKKNIIIQLKNFKRIHESFPKFPECGEIDFLAVNLSIKTIFVMDAKAYYQKFRPKDIKNEINDMFERKSKKKKSNLIHLNKKIEFVSKNLGIFLDYFNIIDKNDWKIKGGFILKNNLHSVYYSGENIDNILIENLGNYLKTD